MRCCVRRWREQHVQHAIENTRFMACFQAVSVDGCPMRAAHHAIELRISRFQHAALRLLSPAASRCALSAERALLPGARSGFGRADVWGGVD